MRRSCPSYLGSSLSATPLCIWNALVLSCFFFFPQKSTFLQTWQLNFWLCARILTCSLYWMDTWLGQQMLRTGAAHCESPESAASPSHQFFLKAYSHMAPVPRCLLRSDRATSFCPADRHIIHLYQHIYCECLITSILKLDVQEGAKLKIWNYEENHCFAEHLNILITKEKSWLLTIIRSVLFLKQDLAKIQLVQGMQTIIANNFMQFLYKSYDMTGMTSDASRADQLFGHAFYQWKWHTSKYFR